MTLARASRLLLSFIVMVVVVGSFVDVARRAIQRSRAQHARPITLTMMHWGEQAEDAIVDQLVKQYMDENPNVQIVRINAGNDFRSKYKTMTAAGTPPDVFYLPPDTFPEWASLKLVRPIDDLVKKDIDAGGEKTKALYDDFFPVVLNAYRYDDATGQIGIGPLYGLPKDFTTPVMYVNLDLFAKAGVRVPYDGWTWDEFERTCKKITALSNTPEFAGRKIYGADFDLWAETFRQILWSFGGDFFGPGGFRDVALDSPASQEAMQFIRRSRFDDRFTYNNTGVSTEGKQEFYSGNIGCVGPYGRWMTPRYASITSFRWDVVPLPYKTPKDRASLMFYTAWGMSSKTPHPEECFKLMKFLCSGTGAVAQSRLGLAIPPLKSVAYSKDFLEPQDVIDTLKQTQPEPEVRKLLAHQGQVFLDMIQYVRLQQMPRDAEFWSRLIDNKSKRSLVLGEESTLDNAKEIKSLWLNELDSPLRQHDWQPMRWNVIVFTTIALFVAIIAVVWWRASREKLGALDRSTERTGYTFILPWIIGFVALAIGPMVVSLLLSFTRWSGMEPMSGAKSVGTANYRQMFLNDPQFYQSIKVTFYYVLLVVPLSQIAALAIAVLMNVKVRFIAVYRTFFFIPSLIAASAVGAVMWRQICNDDSGILNVFLRSVLSPFHLRPPDWFGTDAAHWAVPGFVLLSIWGVGSAMILYLAGLKGIPISLYEAATIDGAGRSRQFWNVTLPMLSPLIFYNVVMGIIGSFQTFVQAAIITGGEPNDTSLFYVLNLYRQAFEFHNMGYASALAWVLFVFLLGLTALIFKGAKNLVYYEGLKA